MLSFFRENGRFSGRFLSEDVARNKCRFSACFGRGIPNENAGNKSYLVKVVLGHLTSAEVENSPDKETANFLKRYN